LSASIKCGAAASRPMIPIIPHMAAIRSGSNHGSNQVSESQASAVRKVQHRYLIPDFLIPG
jgi:hypothetical protein